ncbi:hypothetical protein [Zobellia laminariae]|uniref:hypothetical protein n=1 Tax=Zobellia laminariae TaxID=248906 RepID=UPI003EF3E801
MKKTAYLDNNIFIDIEQNSLSTEDLRNNVNMDLNEFFYSDFHLMEANEMTGKTKAELKNLLKKRFTTISLITNNNYVEQESPSNKVFKSKVVPSELFKNITSVLDTNEKIKHVINSVSEQQKADFRNRYKIDPMRMNNFSAQEVIEHVNTKSKSLGGLSIVEMVEKGLQNQTQGQSISMGHRFAGLFELLDLIGYWKDKYNNKSNYARLWDAGHSFLSSYFDYFITDDKRTRNKAKVAFQIYGTKTIAISSNGTE